MHHAHMNLEAIRKLHGYKDQKVFGAALGVDQATVHRMESLHPSVTLRKYLAAAKLLGVSLAEIFADERSAAENLLILHWRSLSTAEQQRWSEHLRLAAGEEPLDEGNPKTVRPSK